MSMESNNRNGRPPGIAEVATRMDNQHARHEPWMAPLNGRCGTRASGSKGSRARCGF